MNIILLQNNVKRNLTGSKIRRTKILIVVDMLLVGYDVPIVQVMYLDKGLREHTLLQAIARVNRLYDPAKTYGSIVLNLLKAPEDVVDYIVLHELCHLKIKEHSHHYWDLVRKFVPDYQDKI